MEKERKEEMGKTFIGGEFLLCKVSSRDHVYNTVPVVNINVL